MSIQPGDKIPSCTLATMGENGPKKISTDEIFAGKTVVLFALPGAFTPTCSAAHLPGYVSKADDIRSKGVDTIACLSVNDAFVMGAWAEQQNAGEILMLADGDAELSKAMGLELDLTGKQFGIRSQRYAMIVKDSVIRMLNVEEPGKFEVSDADSVLRALEQ